MIDAAARRTAVEFIKFGVVGAAGAGVDMATLALALNLLHVGPYAGRLISFPVAATFTWAVNRSLTFRERGEGGLLVEWARYMAVCVVGGVANFAVYSLVVSVANHTAIHLSPSAYLVPYVGVALGSLAGMVFNFSGAKRLVFRER